VPKQHTFFDEHPEFLETSETGNAARRLNMRHAMMIEKNREILDGARVIDIASHDGRWSFAALMANAAHVTGIEGRSDLVEKANQTFAAKGVSADRYKFIQGDAHDVLGAGAGEVDVVMCLGFIYHTLRYSELFSGIRKTGAKHLIIDTRVLVDESKAIKVRSDPVDLEKMAVEDRFSYNGRSLVGTPSIPALKTMLRMYDYEVTAQMDWAGFLRKQGGAKNLVAYADGQRATFVAELRQHEDGPVDEEDAFDDTE
jgi:precorrin-6B methylase 2